MINGKKVFAFIPARAGSKRMPGKNIANFNGKPLIAHSIEQANEAKYVDQVFVSTESQEIADVSIKYNANVPFLRPQELAQDTSNTVDAVLHYLDYMNTTEEGIPDILVVLQPTSPLKTAADIDSAIELLANSSARKVYSVCAFKKSVFWLRSINNAGILENFMDQFEQPDNFDLQKPVYILNGAIYAYYADDILESKQIDDKMIAAYVMPQERSIDIDWEYEFICAESLMKGLKSD